jgi:hypothetical protein
MLAPTPAAATTSELFALAQDSFRTFLQEFASYGIWAHPDLELRPGHGMLCYYDLKDGHIYLSLPDLTEPTGKLQMLFLRSLMRCESQAELDRFFRLFIPYVIAHELAHHFRHHYGLFTQNLWQEEQIANQLAIAVVKHRLTPEDKAFALHALPRALEGLAIKIESKSIAADSYYSFASALNASGQMGDAALDSVEIVQKLFAANPEDILKDSGQLSDELLQRLDQRDELIDSINAQYASDQMRYFYYHIGWLHLALAGRERHYVEEFIRLHLNQREELLPPVPADSNPRESAVLACFKAYRDTLPLSESASRYFYKRYRTLLLASLRAANLEGDTRSEALLREASALLETWRGREKESDALVYLSHLAPPALRRLFPHQIAEHVPAQLPLLHHLPSSADVRLWQHVALKVSDAAARNTLRRLALLDQTDIYRPLPAEMMLELAQTLCRVKLAPGETIIWERELNDDVYILTEGELEASVTQADGDIIRLAAIQPGEVFGEMAFFTQEPRNATVRATMSSECFVLKDSDLRLLAFRHPMLLMQMAGVLAKRLAVFIKARAMEDEARS